MSLHPVGFEPTPPERLGLKSNAFLARRATRDQLGHGYKSLSSLLSGATEQLVGLFSRKSHVSKDIEKRGRGRGTSRTVASAVGAGLATSALGIAAGAMSALALAAIAARA